MGIECADSAGKHGISEEDALYAIGNAIHTSSNVKAAPGLAPNPRQLFIGPPHPQTDRLIEVLVENKGSGEFLIYHVMELSSYYRQQMEEEQQ